MAMTVVDLWTKADLRSEAQAEFSLVSSEVDVLGY
jgi:hypothetical protein